MYTNLYLGFVILFSLSLLALLIHWPLLWLTRRYMPVASSFIVTIVQVSIFSSAIYVAATTAGVPNAERVTMLATISVTAALALQSTVAGVISASKALMARRFAKGDLITIGDHTGTVQAVTVLGTILKTVAADTVYLANSALDGNAITNHTVGGVLQMRLRFPVPESMDHQRARNVVHAAVQGCEPVMNCLLSLDKAHPGNYVLSRFERTESGYIEVIEVVFYIFGASEREHVESWVTREVIRGFNE